MNSNHSELRQHLQAILSELEKLSQQIRASHDLSESAELVLCLRELVQEQVESQYCENSSSTTHAAG